MQTTWTSGCACSLVVWNNMHDTTTIIQRNSQPLHFENQEQLGKFYLHNHEYSGPRRRATLINISLLADFYRDDVMERVPQCKCY